MAGLDGIRSKTEPPEPIDKDLYDLPPEDFANVTQTPGSLPEVLAALASDHDYLLEGGVFTPDLIETWIDWKTENEIDPVRLRPTPYEFEMYFGV
jgi:glutamine synthetase